MKLYGLRGEIYLVHGAPTISIFFYIEILLKEVNFDHFRYTQQQLLILIQIFHTNQLHSLLQFLLFLENHPELISILYKIVINALKISIILQSFLVFCVGSLP